MKFNKEKINKLKKISIDLRIEILNAIFRFKKGHIGGSFSSVDILVCVYLSKIFNLNKINFKKKNNDFFILSKGHSSIALYAVLNHLKLSKFFNLKNFHKPGSFLMEHPSPNKNLPGIEIETGSLGNGIGIGSGIAYANKKNKKKTIILVGDGELYEGSNWEAMLLSSQYKLGNLAVIVDRNFSITLDKTESIMKLENLKKKFLSFGFKTHVVDGHNYSKLLDYLVKFKKNISKKPVCLICKTVKGKGSKLLENNLKFHHAVPSVSEYSEILKHLGDK